MLQRTTEIEATTLGLIFLFDHLNEKILLLEKDDFSSETLKSLFAVLRKIYNERGDINQAITLDTVTKEQKVLLMDCADRAVAPSVIDDYIAELKRGASSRRLISEVNNLIYYNCCTTESLQKVIEDEKQKTVDYNTAAEKSSVNIQEYLKQLGKPKDLIKTGFSDIDQVIMGIERGTLFLIGARPSTGKTTFSLNLAANMIKAGHKVIVFSLEMSSRMMYDRLLSNILNINYMEFVTNSFKDYECDRINKQANEIKDSEKLFIFDDVNTVENICSYIYREKPDVAVVDFVQCINTLAQFNDIRMQINYISSELKRAAKRTGCVVIALSQLTRTGKDAPTMSDLRESGALEQDGDYIILLNRPYVNDKTKDPTETEVLIDKNKFGRTGLRRFYFDGKHQRFNGCFGSESEAENADLPFH